jgi:hypothetical protein
LSQKLGKSFAAGYLCREQKRPLGGAFFSSGGRI